MADLDKRSPVIEAGHGLYGEVQGERALVKDGLTFVDAANDADSAQDGTAEHPFASLREAARRAGENAILFVRPGLYEESVRLAPGQTLTSVVDLEGPLAGEQYATSEMPRIVPDNLEDAGGEERADMSAAVQAWGPTTIRRMAIEGMAFAAPGEDRDDDGFAAALLLTVDADAPETTELVARDCALRGRGRANALVVYARKDARVSAVRIQGNDCVAEDANACAVVLGKKSRLEVLEIADNTMVSGLDDAESGKATLHVELGGKEARLARFELVRNRLASEARKSEALYVSLPGRSSRLETAEIAENRVRARGELADGVFFSVRRSVADRFVLRANEVETQGERGYGFNLWARDEGRVEALLCEENRITTSGKDSRGIHMEVGEDGLIESLEARANRIVTTGPSAECIGLTVHDEDAVLNRALLADNELETRGENAEALYVSARESGRLNTVEITGGALRTTGEYGDGFFAVVREEGEIRSLVCRGLKIETEEDRGHAVNLWATRSGSLTDVDLREVTVVTAGDRAQGLHVEVDRDARLENLTARDMRIETRGDVAHGCYVCCHEGEGSRLTGLDFGGNEVSTEGGGADACCLIIEDGAVERVTLAANRLNTGGKDADGIDVILREGCRVRGVNLRDNRIETSGKAGDGIEIAALDEDVRCDDLLIQGNEMATSGSRAHGVHLRGEADGLDRLALNPKALLADNTVHVRGKHADALCRDSSEDDEDSGSSPRALPRRSADVPDEI